MKHEGGIVSSLTLGLGFFNTCKNLQKQALDQEHGLEHHHKAGLTDAMGMVQDTLQLLMRKTGTVEQSLRCDFQTVI